MHLCIHLYVLVVVCTHMPPPMYSLCPSAEHTTRTTAFQGSEFQCTNEEEDRAQTLSAIESAAAWRRQHNCDKSCKNCSNNSKESIGHSRSNAGSRAAKMPIPMYVATSKTGRQTKISQHSILHVLL